MPLSMTTPINRNDIHSIVPIKATKVFLLRGFRHDELIVKVEDNVKEGSVHSTKHIAKAIDKTAVARLLGPTELLELREYVKSIVDGELFMSGISGYVQSPNYPELCATHNALQNPAGPVTKMKKLRVLDLDSVLLQACEQHNTTAHAKFVTALSDPNGLEMVGEIVAADLFMGNNDRFDFVFDAGDTKHYGPVTLNFKRLINVGNVMIAIDPLLEGKGGSEGYRPVMLDYLDPYSSTMKNLANDPKYSLKQVTSKEYAAKKYLLEANARQQAAEQVAHDLLLCANPFGNNPGVFKYVEDMRVLAGLESGIRKILKHLYGRKLHPFMEEMYNLLSKQFK